MLHLYQDLLGLSPRPLSLQIKHCLYCFSSVFLIVSYISAMEVVRYLSTGSHTLLSNSTSRVKLQWYIFFIYRQPNINGNYFRNICFNYTINLLPHLFFTTIFLKYKESTMSIRQLFIMVLCIGFPGFVSTHFSNVPRQPTTLTSHFFNLQSIGLCLLPQR